VAVSADGCATWNVPVFTVQGAVGPGVTPGTDRYIQWNAGTDWPGQFNSQCKLRITADDGTAPSAPSGMVYIPGGAFRMGDTLNDGNTAELPVHSVFISSFFMDRYLVTRELWVTVDSYALSAGYGFDNGGSYKAASHPVQTINWYDAVKWCNARSQRDGLTPYYYTDAGLTTVYKAGQIAPYVNTSASGYRLPTEAEWEKAARGGLSGLRFPWGNTISESQANYYGNTSAYSYDLGPNGYNSIGSIGGTSPATSPVGSFAANGYGLYDMAGNVLEWCWDWYDQNWYGNYQATMDDPRGPASGTYRLLRGGIWNYNASRLRCASRDGYYTPSSANAYGFGFRCVRGL
jgi:formylglycine-generating enzyme required for sulfatase activity